MKKARGIGVIGGYSFFKPNNMKQLSEIQQGDFVEYIHNTGKIKKGFTIGISYRVLKVKEYLGAAYEFILMSEDGVKRTFKTSTDQFRYYDFKSKEETVLKLQGVILTEGVDYEINHRGEITFSNDILKNEESAHPWPELNKMAPSDLMALRSFIGEHIDHYRHKAIKEDLSSLDKTLVDHYDSLTSKFEYHLTIVQEHIDKSTAHYFGEESKS